MALLSLSVALRGSRAEGSSRASIHSLSLTASTSLRSAIKGLMCRTGGRSPFDIRGFSHQHHQHGRSVMKITTTDLVFDSQSSELSCNPALAPMQVILSLTLIGRSPVRGCRSGSTVSCSQAEDGREQETDWGPCSVEASFDVGLNAPAEGVWRPRTTLPPLCGRHVVFRYHQASSMGP
jgi:hypothetical protein